MDQFEDYWNGLQHTLDQPAPYVGFIPPKPRISPKAIKNTYPHSMQFIGMVVKTSEDRVVYCSLFMHSAN